MNENYVGIDYHKKYSHVTAVDPQGQVIMSRRIDNDVELFREFFNSLGGKSRAVLEASRTWGVMYDLLEGLDEVESVSLAHPLKVRAIAEAKIKTDKIDAETLAQLLRANLIPAAHIPCRETRSIKEMIRQRVFLVRMRTRLKNRIHVLLDRLRIPLPAVSDLFGQRGLRYLRGLCLSGVDQEILQEDLKLLEVFNGLIREAEKQIHCLTKGDEKVRRLQSIPGLGPILAAVVGAEIDEIERFSSPSKLASYAGLVPSTYASGGKTWHGRLVPWCNKWLRWAFVEAAWVAVRNSAYCRGYYARVKQRKGAHTAAVALARRLSEIVWHVLTEKRKYEERLPGSRMKPVTTKDPIPAALTTA